MGDEILREGTDLIGLRGENKADEVGDILSFLDGRGEHGGLLAVDGQSAHERNERSHGGKGRKNLGLDFQAGWRRAGILSSSISRTLRTSVAGV